MFRSNRTMDGRAQFGTALGILALGGAAGYMAGLLTAPSSGQETRRRLGRRIDDERHDVLRRGRRALEDAVERLQWSLEQGRRRLSRRFAA